MGLSVAGHVLEASLAAPGSETVARWKPVLIGVFFSLFLVMAFSAVPLFVRAFFLGFTRIQKAAGNEKHPLVGSLIERQERIGTVLIWAYWILFLVGLAIAAPHLSEMWRE